MLTTRVVGKYAAARRYAREISHIFDLIAFSYSPPPPPAAAGAYLSLESAITAERERVSRKLLREIRNSKRSPRAWE